MGQRVKRIRDSFRGKNDNEEKIAQPVGSLGAGKSAALTRQVFWRRN
jgi:hypothetical protein